MFENLRSVEFIEIELANEERRARYTVYPSAFELNDEIQLSEQESDQETLVSFVVLDQNEAPWEMGYNSNPDVLALHLPYLNPWKNYEDYLGITMLAPKLLVVEDILGRGIGWRTKYIDRSGDYHALIRIVEKIAFAGSYVIGKVRWYIHWR